MAIYHAITIPLLDGRGGLVVRSRLWGLRLPGLKPDSTRLGLLHGKSKTGVKRPLLGVVRQFGKGVPAQVLFSPSDGGSKLRGLSLNSLRVASKRDVNIT
ncbi:hypothetical protein AVEN_63252-1 [Araneus ventricosus]|uniref:Uncharacterized protein n=1 Tax=Araneus ventricosus TaxID=182803 RepID=A0A4Y2B394_ARAVE|nr:hypothetical protein AVEN_63252-1 [Araneus ventricosus]